MSSTRRAKLIALVDCNNFYVSCERVFHPEWAGKPVVVLSNNDGCIVARSNEAKRLGIPMGAPYFRYKAFLSAHNVIVCSSNYTLYGDMSRRVMKILEDFSSDIQIYSIDEAFLTLQEEDAESLGKKMRETVLKWTGIPISVGIAPTKTLAKVANACAKKDPAVNGVFKLVEKEAFDRILDTLPVIDVWGIGSRLGKRLNRLGIVTAKQLCEADDNKIKKNFSVVLLRTKWELKGTPCLTLDEVPAPKKSVTCSRAFGRPIDKLDEFLEAVATYTARAAEKIRQQDSVTALLTVFAELHPFDPERPGCFHVRVNLPQPTNFTPHLLHYAKSAAMTLFNEGNSYRKAGVIMDGLLHSDCFQADLFFSEGPSSEKQRRLMQTIDGLNVKYGPSKVRTAAEGVDPSWKMKHEKRTGRFTTSWDEIMTLQI